MSLACSASWCVSLGWAGNCRWHGTASYPNKNPVQLSTDSHPSRCNYGGNVTPCVLLLQQPPPHCAWDARARCQHGVSQRDRERQGKLCNAEESAKPGPRALLWYSLAWIICEKDFQNLHGTVLDLARWSSLIQSEGSYSTQKAGHDSDLEPCNRTVQSLMNSEKVLSDLKQLSGSQLQRMGDVSKRLITNNWTSCYDRHQITQRSWNSECGKIKSRKRLEHNLKETVLFCTPLVSELTFFWGAPVLCRVYSDSQN